MGRKKRAEEAASSADARAARRRGEPPRAREPLVAILAALVVANLIVYWGVWRYGFISFDDPQYMQPQQLRQGLSWESISWAFTSTYFANWHPLTWLSYLLDIELHGLSAGGFHLTSLLLHIANTLLLFHVLRKATRATAASAVAAALFAAHPLHVESVVWIAERKDVLSALFWILAMWAYLRYARQPGMTRYLLVAVFFAAGLMSKAMVVTLPLALLLLDYWPLGRLRLSSEPATGEEAAAINALPEDSASGCPPAPAWRLVAEKLPLLALAAVSSVITVRAQASTDSVVQLGALSFASRAANALVAYAAYLADAVWPSGLAVFYPYPDAWPAWRVAASAAVLLAITALVLWQLRRRGYLAVGWFWFLGTLVPVIGLVQVGEQSRADRYMYLPLIGLLLMALGAQAEFFSKLAARQPQRDYALQAAAAVGVLACLWAGRAQVRVWQDNVSLWQQAVKATSNNDRAEMFLGVALSDAGRNAEAITHYQEALRIRPNHAYAHNNLAIALAEQGQYAEAITHYREVLRLRPNMGEAHNNLGAALANTGKIDEAIQEFLAALRSNPNNPDWHNNLATMYQQKGDMAAAQQHMAEAQRLLQAR